MSGLPSRSPEPGLALPAGEVHLWAVPLDPPAALLDRLGRSLSPDEHERARRFRFDIHRRRYVAGRGAVRHLLAAYRGTDPAALRFTYGPRGKPELAQPGDLQFNFSNSEDLGLLGVVRGLPIGVDLEYLKEMPDLEPIAERFFSAEEVAALARVAAEQKKLAFFNCWTRKEAYLKAVGEGLAAPLDSFVVTLTPGEPPRMLSLEGSRERAERWFYHHLVPAEGYVGAFTVERPGPWEVRAWRYAPEGA